MGIRIILSAILVLGLMGAFVVPDHPVLGEEGPRVLVVVGEFSFPANVIAANLATEAISDFVSLGYRPVVIYRTHSGSIIPNLGITKGEHTCLLVRDHPNWYETSCGFFEKEISPGMIWDWLVNVSSVKAFVLIAHGLRDPLGFQFERNMRWPEHVCLAKVVDYVILHSCYQDNDVTRAYFSSSLPPGSSPQPPSKVTGPFFKGYTGWGLLYTSFLWQWLKFPSGGPHKGPYIEIDRDLFLDAFQELSVEEMATLLEPDIELDIPDSAEGPAMGAFLLLATAHNDLILGYEAEAVNKAKAAYELLRGAYHRGWEEAKIFAEQLGVVLGIEQENAAGNLP